MLKLAFFKVHFFGGMFFSHVKIRLFATVHKYVYVFVAKRTSPVCRCLTIGVTHRVSMRSMRAADVPHASQKPRSEFPEELEIIARASARARVRGIRQWPPRGHEPSRKSSQCKRPAIATSRAENARCARPRGRIARGEITRRNGVATSATALDSDDGRRVV